MGIQQLDSVNIMKTVADKIITAEEIAAFTAKYSYNEPLVIIGDVLQADLPTEEDAPYIYIYGASKSEGIETDPCEYQISIGVGISQTGQDTLTNGLIVHKGYSIVSEFMEIIQKVLFNYREMANTQSNVIGSVDPGASHWVGNLILKWNVEQTISGNQEF